MTVFPAMYRSSVRGVFKCPMTFLASVRPVRWLKVSTLGVSFLSTISPMGRQVPSARVTSELYGRHIDQTDSIDSMSIQSPSLTGP